MYTRSLQPPKTSFFLLGARGTGKSTWLRAHFADAPYVDLLDVALYQRLMAHPGEFYEMLVDVPPGSFVVVDEIQRAPVLLNEVHRLIENRKLKFALSGSSARKLRRAGVNLLAGRASQQFMHPLLPSEMGEDYSLDRAMRLGTMPIVVDSESAEQTLAAYSQLYLQHEIQAEALVAHLGGFARFLPVAALFHAQTLNIASLARDAEVPRPTIRGYLDILADTLLARTLPAYSSKLRVREKKHPKLYFVDSGIVRSCKNLSGKPAPEELGPLFEGIVHSLLIAHQDYRRIYDTLHYWSPAEAKLTEVDFVLCRGKERIAIEAKSSTNLSAADLRGLRAIAELPGLSRQIVVYRGRIKRITDDGIEILPFDHFLKALQTL